MSQDFVLIHDKPPIVTRKPPAQGGAYRVGLTLEGLQRKSCVLLL